MRNLRKPDAPWQYVAVDANRDVVLSDEDHDADGHGGRWRAARERASELVQQRFSQYSRGWGWSSWHLARDLVAVSVFVLGHRLGCTPEKITGADVVGLLGEAARRHWTEAHSEAYCAQRGYRVSAVYSQPFNSEAYREYQRGLDLWHAARRAQIETLSRQMSAGLSSAGVDLDDGEDVLVRTWRWLNHEPPAPTERGDRSDRIESCWEIRQPYLREAAEYAISLLGASLRGLTGGRTVSDLQRDGWWSGRVETDARGHVFVAEEPTRPDEPRLPGSTGTVMVSIAADGRTTVTNVGPGDVVVVQRSTRGEHNQDQWAPAPETSVTRSAEAALTESLLGSLSAVLDRVATARLVLVESQPELWDGLWRLGSEQGPYQHVEVEPCVPFAPEVIGAALLGWHDWHTRQVNPLGDPRDAAEGWTASTVLVRVPALAEWIPIHVTPIST